MTVFELHFNPRNKGERAFDSFVYESETPEEKELGSLCMAGELSRAMPQNIHFLDILSSSLKDAFYQKASFQDALKEANGFLEQEAKNGNVGWLGNLNFAVINLNNSILNFAKTGNIKILLIRESEILDISQNLELQDTEPYPLKVFSNIASGKLSPEDKILITTKDVFSALSRNEDLLNQFHDVVDEKEFKAVFRRNKESFSDASGICLLAAMGGNTKDRSWPAIGFSRFPKKIALVVIFVVTMAVSYFIFGEEKKNETNQAQQILKEARSKITMAESFLIIKKDEKAQALFQEAWDILQSLPDKEASELRESIKKYIISTQP